MSEKITILAGRNGEQSSAHSKVRRRISLTNDNVHTLPLALTPNYLFSILRFILRYWKKYK